jgi:hypothetical protein
MIRRVFLLVVLCGVFCLPLYCQGQKITIPVVDNCGFIIQGTVQITATVLANPLVSVSSIQMTVDATPIGMPLLPPNFTTPWDTTTTPNGCHTVSALVSDSAGNSVTVSIPVSIKNK